MQRDHALLQLGIQFEIAIELAKGEGGRFEGENASFRTNEVSQMERVGSYIGPNIEDQ